MNAFDEAYKLQRDAFVRGLSSYKQPEPEQGRCWECALFVECQHAVGVDDMDSCIQWRERFFEEWT